jgi:hypothetical protein
MIITRSFLIDYNDGVSLHDQSIEYLHMAYAPCTRDLNYVPAISSDLDFCQFQIKRIIVSFLRLSGLVLTQPTALHVQLDLPYRYC